MTAGAIIPVAARLEIGLGAGAGPADYRQLGLPFDSGAVRVGCLEEAVSIIKRFFMEESDYAHYR